MNCNFFKVSLLYSLHAADGMPTEEPFQIEASEQIVNIAPVGAAKIEVGKNINIKFLMLTYFL